MASEPPPLTGRRDTSAQPAEVGFACDEEARGEEGVPGEPAFRRRIPTYEEISELRAAAAAAVAAMAAPKGRRRATTARELTPIPTYEELQLSAAAKARLAAQAAIEDRREAQMQGRRELRRQQEQQHQQQRQQERSTECAPAPSGDPAKATPAARATCQPPFVGPGARPSEAGGFFLPPRLRAAAAAVRQLERVRASPPHHACRCPRCGFSASEEAFRVRSDGCGAELDRRPTPAYAGATAPDGQHYAVLAARGGRNDASATQQPSAVWYDRLRGTCRTGPPPAKAPADGAADRGRESAALSPPLARPSGEAPPKPALPPADAPPAVGGPPDGGAAARPQDEESRTAAIYANVLAALAPAPAANAAAERWQRATRRLGRMRSFSFGHCDQVAARVPRGRRLAQELPPRAATAIPSVSTQDVDAGDAPQAVRAAGSPPTARAPQQHGQALDGQRPHNEETIQRRRSRAIDQSAAQQYASLLTSARRPSGRAAGGGGGGPGSARGASAKATLAPPLRRHRSRSCEDLTLANEGAVCAHTGWPTYRMGRGEAEVALSAAGCKEGLFLVR